MTQRASGYASVALDKFYTPRWVTEALLSVETFAGGVWDPAAGRGDMLDVFGPDSHGSDIAPERDGIQPIDFFEIKAGGRWPNIVTNPPFGVGNRLAVQFIEHALEVTMATGGKVAMLLRVDFDSAKTRRHLFAEHSAFAAKYVLLKRIRWTNLPQMAAGPTENHAWYVWDWRKRGGAPSIGYLPIEGAAS